MIQNQLIFVINCMQCWNLLLLTLLYFSIANSLFREQKQVYNLKQAESTNYTIQAHDNSRLAIVQYQGSSQVSLYSQSQQLIFIVSGSIYENQIPKQYYGQNMTLTIVAKSIIAVGWIFIQSVQTYQLLSISQQKFVHLRKGEIRTIQIHPRKKTKLLIQRFDGTPLLINNRCKNYEKQDCMNEMSRLDAFSMKKHFDIIDLEYCSNCLLLIKISTKSEEVRLRFSMEATRTILEDYPTASILKKDEMVSFQSYGDVQLGKVIFYSGSVSVASQNAVAINFPNGLNIQTLNNTNETSAQRPFLLSLKGSDNLNYFIMEGSQTQSRVINLVDGFPNAIQISPQQTVVCRYQNHNMGRANIQLSAPSQFLQRVSIKFINKRTNEHYLVRPKYLFNHTIASQNFQLDQSNQEIQIQIHLTSGESGYLNISANVKQLITLPLDLEYSSILHYLQFDEYIIQGITGNIQIVVTKCVECSISIFVGEQLDTRSQEIIFEGIYIRIPYLIKQDQVYIKIQTSNYGYYSLIARRQTTLSLPKLVDESVQFYLTDESQQKMLIEFTPPVCDNKACQHSKFYLLQGSNPLQLSSKVYCPQNLFDFDQRVKDIVVEQIKPILLEGMLSFTRQIKHRDYIGIMVQINETILPYQIINIQEIKLYHQMRWPFFYLALFITTALFFSFVIFMGLRRKKFIDAEGYVRISAASSLEQI